MKDVLFRNVSDDIYNLLLDSQHRLTKEKKRKVSMSETLALLLKKAYLEVKDKKDGNQ